MLNIIDGNIENSISCGVAHNLESGNIYIETVPGEYAGDELQLSWYLVDENGKVLVKQIHSYDYIYKLNSKTKEVELIKIEEIDGEIEQLYIDEIVKLTKEYTVRNPNVRVYWRLCNGKVHCTNIIYDIM
ncbi:hypothetical protein [Clostridium faecium]|uniref:Uncharacterized protein n=1 Tax=Clostridium faecium TaxID=2762223 RepID=A0ABR8YRZ7_9CLOT|nr:hypothetical protein [Clostridium faecium]MBD8046644.1 hypothetical protein [Clostridium faecium]